MAKKFTNYREASRIDWGTWLESGTNVDRDQIQLGAVLRIADATEKMALNHQQLIDERDRYKRWWTESSENVKHLERVIASLRGHITTKNRVIAELGERAK